MQHFFLLKLLVQCSVSGRFELSDKMHIVMIDDDNLTLCDGNVSPEDELHWRQKLSQWQSLNYSEYQISIDPNRVNTRSVVSERQMDTAFICPDAAANNPNVMPVAKLTLNALTGIDRRCHRSWENEHDYLPSATQKSACERRKGG
ncbi:hypothetical protein JOB18_029235 [Solea senegalensis]|uniref:Uncharacterized protein n=1 Tax=Solea senegalensis TaxID=28829 RepID=A0AAV6SL64_SOLSE|nr:hypothetical protein JOB18_029235 [Solea senegalensis]